MFNALNERLQERWEEFKEGEPGSRFEERYRRRREEGGARFGPMRLLYIAGGVLVMLAGLVMMVAPGPGIAAFVLGLSFLGSEFLVIARLMDWGEVRLRHGFEWSLSTWNGAPLPARIGLALLMLALAVALAYGFYRFAFTRWV